LTLTRVEGLLYSDSKPICLDIADGYISEIHRPEKIDTDFFIAPGLIDIQVNGYNSVGFTEQDLSIDNIKVLVNSLWEKGITSFLPTFITTSPEILLKNLGILADAIKDPAIGNTIPGFHLEGPYISEVEGPRGAHEIEWIRNPDWSEFEKFQQAAGGKILLHTLAPEKKGAIEIIKKCKEANVVCALGHHNATAELIYAAIDAGATLATHLGNGGMVHIHRHDNHIWPQLAADNLAASIIADGFHLRSEELKVFYKVKGQDKLILISDITYLTGLPAGNYSWLKEEIQVQDNGKVSVLGKDILAGASLPLKKGITNMSQLTDCSFAEAMDMATRNPANLLELDDRGIIEKGKRADLILFRYTENEIDIYQTILAGEIVYIDEKETLKKTTEGSGRYSENS
jgi:N-acetylglucosamine-6-phosphate deacetylase